MKNETWWIFLKMAMLVNGVKKEDQEAGFRYKARLVAKGRN